MANFKKTKQEAWIYYKKWTKEKTFCPVLDKNVNITRKGWNHILGGGSSKRRIKDKHLRLTLLKSAKYIIKNAKSTYVNKKNGEAYTILEGDVTMGQSRGRIRVILKTDKQGKLYFYSVMKR